MDHFPTKGKLKELINLKGFTIFLMTVFGDYKISKITYP